MTATRRPSHRPVSTPVIAALLMMLCLAAPPVRAEALEETKVKAAFILRFVQYIEWPQEASPQGPLVIGVAGADAVSAELSQMTAARGVQGRPVTIRAVKGADSLTGIHVLFVGNSEKARVAQYAGALRGRRVLIVTESPNALEQGSMINFVIQESRVRFEIALDAVETNGLTMSSRLLSVALRVQKGN